MFTFRVGVSTVRYKTQPLAAYTDHRVSAAAYNIFASNLLRPCMEAEKN
jgi:hypothetical protein